METKYHASLLQHMKLRAIGMVRASCLETARAGYDGGKVSLEAMAA